MNDRRRIAAVIKSEAEEIQRAAHVKKWDYIENAVARLLATAEEITAFKLDDAEALLAHWARGLDVEREREFTSHSYAVLKRVRFRQGQRYAVFEEVPGERQEQILALLHDLVEDCCPPTKTQNQFFKMLDVPVWLKLDLVAISRNPLDTYDEYIARVAAAGKRVQFVKRCDLEVNLERCTGKPEYANLEKRYRKALETLPDFDKL